MTTPISIHQRNYQTEAFDEGDGTMRVVGRLTDTKPHGLGLADGEPLVIHDMVVELRIDAATFEIVDIDATMNVHPYDQCTTVVDAYRRLIGVSIARGYSRTVKDLFGGALGCSHIGALLIALGPVAVQASWGMSRMHEDPSEWAAREMDPEATERMMRLNANTCHVWAVDGEKMARIRSGEEMPRPGWVSERLVELGVRVEQP